MSAKTAAPKKVSAANYTVRRYAAAGHAGEEGDGEILCTEETIEAARARIFSRVGDHGQWIDDDGHECWHESDEEGCGGYEIIEN